MAVSDIIDLAIEQCNELGNYLLPDFLITNMEIPTNEQLTEYINEMRKTEITEDIDENDDLVY